MSHVEGIFLAADRGAPLREVLDARAVPGRGLEGDRYFFGKGQFSAKPGSRQITLIESEAIQAVADHDGLALDPGETRRNLVTRGVALNHLVGADFMVGDVRLRGVKLCEPCTYLETTTGRDGIKAAFIHRGGLRADIVSEGVIRKGDSIYRVDSTS